MRNGIDQNFGKSNSDLLLEMMSTQNTISEKIGIIYWNEYDFLNNPELAIQTGVFLYNAYKHIQQTSPEKIDWIWVLGLSGRIYYYLLNLFVFMIEQKYIPEFPIDDIEDIQKADEKLSTHNKKYPSPEWSKDDYSEAIFGSKMFGRYWSIGYLDDAYFDSKNIVLIDSVLRSWKTVTKASERLKPLNCTISWGIFNINFDNISSKHKNEANIPLVTWVDFTKLLDSLWICLGKKQIVHYHPYNMYDWEYVMKYFENLFWYSVNEFFEKIKGKINTFEIQQEASKTRLTETLESS